MRGPDGPTVQEPVSPRRWKQPPYCHRVMFANLEAPVTPVKDFLIMQA